LNKKQIYIAVTAAAFVLALIVWWFRSGGDNYGDNNANFPDGMVFICSSDACNHAFAMTMTEYGEHHKNHYGEPIACPKCSKTPAIRGVQCKACKTISVLQQNVTTCPKCGAPLESPR
jgi:hypothetical protein